MLRSIRNDFVQCSGLFAMTLVMHSGLSAMSLLFTIALPAVCRKSRAQHLKAYLEFAKEHGLEANVDENMGTGSGTSTPAQVSLTSCC